MTEFKLSKRRMLLESLVTSVAMGLCYEKGSCTSEEIRSTIKSEYPTLDILGQDVSTIMDTVSCEKTMQLENPKALFIEEMIDGEHPYRVFTIQQDTDSIVTELSTSGKRYVTKSDIIDRILDVDCELIGITWIKKNGEQRTLDECIPMGMDRMGYIVVQLPEGGCKRVDPRKVLSAKIKNIELISK